MQGPCATICGPSVAWCDGEVHRLWGPRKSVRKSDRSVGAILPAVLRERSLLTGSRAARIKRFIADESGLTAVEFGVLSCVMAMVVVSFASSGLSFVGLFRRIGLLAGVLVSEEDAPVRPDH